MSNKEDFARKAIAILLDINNRYDRDSGTYHSMTLFLPDFAVILAEKNVTEFLGQGAYSICYTDPAKTIVCTVTDGSDLLKDIYHDYGGNNPHIPRIDILSWDLDAEYTLYQMPFYTVYNTVSELNDSQYETFTSLVLLAKTSNCIEDIVNSEKFEKLPESLQAALEIVFDEVDGYINWDMRVDNVAWVGDTIILLDIVVT